MSFLPTMHSPSTFVATPTAKDAGKHNLAVCPGKESKMVWQTNNQTANNQTHCLYNSEPIPT